MKLTPRIPSMALDAGGSAGERLTYQMRTAFEKCCNSLKPD